MFYVCYLHYLCIQVMIFMIINTIFTSAIKLSLISMGLLVEPILDFFLSIIGPCGVVGGPSLGRRGA
jgi:hypothetical protein